MRFKIENDKLLVSDDLPQNIGLCYFCHRAVYASAGQAIKWKIITQGETKTEYPTHKSCRKLDRRRKK